MELTELFAAALGLHGTPWSVSHCRFEGEPRALELHLDFRRGSRFECPHCRALCPVHDTVERRWRHLNFFQFRCDLVARVPRVKCENDGVTLISTPWARPESGFTLLMEAMILLLAQSMTVSEIADVLNEHDTRLWRGIGFHVEAAHRAKDWSGVRRILVDETSARRGHRYVSVFLDEETRELLLMVEGRSADAIGAFVQALRAHGGCPEQIEWVGMDMSQAYRSGVQRWLPNAQIAFDHFHLTQLAGNALDQVRLELAREGASMKGGLWALRGNEWNRTDEQRTLRTQLCNAYPKLGRAMGLKDMLVDILHERDVEGLIWWCRRADRSRLPAFRKLSKTLKSHWDGILGFFHSGITSAAIEAVNGLIQLAKRAARGFRNFAYFRWMAYLKAGNLHIAVLGNLTH